MDTNTLASEMLSELKATSKRWFIAFCIMVGLELATIGAFIWYITLPVEETTIEQSSDNDSENTIIGGDYNGFKTESDTKEESSSQEKEEVDGKQY